ncbi:class II aldolase and Adducin N-terminal domain-containing protein [Achaetomium macrosporum]|uniref:Class II aldolase and Adducin N-terminal domain-containing protein n=1 Tax=Achaetomium macrosporum TaxID=79813 RepID=A0AAN7C8H7_9PEZI|nr:class II aldolase and Adducin N-terminal domain-containing protein [Achaetomium macrosporum]
MASTNITQLLATYIHALHILHHHGVLDGYGHLSVRNPDNAATFFMMHQRAPALVSGLDDIGEYRVSDAEPVSPGTPAAPLERYIHSETLERYPDINVVLHGHAGELVSYSISDVPLRAAIHMAPFLGEEVPNFDITKYYLPNDTHDFLVRDQRLGAALAAEFDSHWGPGNKSSLVLMRSHGFTAIAADIETTTYKGIYAVVNARVQSEAIKIQHAYSGPRAEGGGGIAYLTPRQIRDSWQTEKQLIQRPWALWVREVKVNPLYVNELDPDR